MLYSVELRSHYIYFNASGFKPEMLYSVELRSSFLKSEGKDINLSDTEQL
jgi:hypothetical protein